MENSSGKSRQEEANEVGGHEVRMRIGHITDISAAQQEQRANKVSQACPKIHR